MTLRYSNFALRDRLLKGDEPAWLAHHSRRSYIRQIVFATVPWSDLKAIRALDKRAKHKSLVTGRKWVLDHVIPITHKHVCGLNIAQNIQVIPEGTNALKSNHWCEWHGDLFNEPEQLSLWPASLTALHCGLGLSLDGGSAVAGDAGAAPP